MHLISGYLCDSGAGATEEVNPSVYLRSGELSRSMSKLTEGIRYRVVKDLIGPVAPSLFPLESVDSTL
jgi:hypothetical protein